MKIHSLLIATLLFYPAIHKGQAPVITVQPLSSTLCAGQATTLFTDADGDLLTWRWEVSPDATFSSRVTLTNSSIYDNTTTSALRILNNITLNGNYYRAIVTNADGSDTTDASLVTAIPPTLPAFSTAASQFVGFFNNHYFTGTCDEIAYILPSGASPVTDRINATVIVETIVPVYASQPFVQRRYMLDAVLNPSTSTATITIYFSQAEFDAFNAAPGSVLKLPTGTGDAAGKANLRVAKYSGTSSDGSGLPGSYSNGVTIIDPDDANIVWNAAFGRWEITFDIIGFSGFIVQTSPFTLPVNLVSFSAQVAGLGIQTKWVTDGETNNDYFELERSLDGRTFNAIGRVNGFTGSGIKNYNYTDAAAASLSVSKLYYRLKIVSVSGAVEYSNTIVVSLGEASRLITNITNPVHGPLTMRLNIPAGGRMMVRVTDLLGRTLVQQNTVVPKGFSTQEIHGMEKLANGVYLVSVETAGRVRTVKVVKK